VLYGGDYASFPNSSGGAVVHSNYLVGIHVGSIYVEDEVEVGIEKEVDKKGKGKNEIKAKVAFVEENLKHKSSLGSFIASSIIHSFLVQHKLMKLKNLPMTSSSQAQSRERSRFVMNKS
jgi:hypothetical protein